LSGQHKRELEGVWNSAQAKHDRQVVGKEDGREVSKHESQEDSEEVRRDHLAPDKNRTALRHVYLARHHRYPHSDSQQKSSKAKLEDSCGQELDDRPRYREEIREDYCLLLAQSLGDSPCEHGTHCGTQYRKTDNVLNIFRLKLLLTYLRLWLAQGKPCPGKDKPQPRWLSCSRQRSLQGRR